MCHQPGGNVCVVRDQHSVVRGKTRLELAEHLNLIISQYHPDPVPEQASRYIRCLEWKEIILEKGYVSRLALYHCQLFLSTSRETHDQPVQVAPLYGYRQQVIEPLVHQSALLGNRGSPPNTGTDTVWKPPWRITPAGWVSASRKKSSESGAVTSCTVTITRTSEEAILPVAVKLPFNRRSKDIRAVRVFVPSADGETLKSLHI